MTMLEVSNVEKSYSGLSVLRGIDFEIGSGEMTGLIGPNGAGKTTLFDCITGVESIDSGSVRFDGKDVTDDPTYQRARAGMIRTFQTTREIETMTLVENLMLAAKGHPGERFLPAISHSEEMVDFEAQIEARARELLEDFELDHLADDYASSLSGGQRKLIELARALMIDPDTLLLDEPFAGVNPALTEDIAGHISDLNEQGLTIFIIEHELHTLTQLVDRTIVLSQGEIIEDGDPENIYESEEVIEAYLGEGFEQMMP